MNLFGFVRPIILEIMQQILEAWTSRCYIERSELMRTTTTASSHEDTAFDE